MKHQNLIYELILEKPLEVLIMATTKEKSIEEKEKVFMLLIAISVYLDLCKKSPELWDCGEQISINSNGHIAYKCSKKIYIPTIYDLCSMQFLGSERKFYELLSYISKMMYGITNESEVIKQIIRGYNRTYNKSRVEQIWM